MRSPHGPASSAAPSPFAGSDGFDPLEEAVRGHVRSFIEQLLEEEVDAALGRERYERGTVSKGRRHGHRGRGAQDVRNEPPAVRQHPAREVLLGDARTDYRAAQPQLRRRRPRCSSECFRWHHRRDRQAHQRKCAFGSRSRLRLPSWLLARHKRPSSAPCLPRAQSRPSV